MDVYLLWDNSRAEHGEGPTLVDIYATEQQARENQQSRTDYSEIDEDFGPDMVAELVEEASDEQFSIERREVIA